jgi:preprotein translocase subunit SecE
MANSTKSEMNDSSAGGGLATADNGRKSSKKTGGRSVSESVSQDSSGGDRRAGAHQSFFEVYKPGQGHYTRMLSAVGGVVLILGAGNFVFTELEVVTDASWVIYLQAISAAAVVVGFGLLLYWLVYVKRGSCDFLIATEGEMKKVSWSSRNELIGSTKVVIAFTLFLGLMLFLVDMVFIQFFRFIGVLHSG